MSIFVRMCVRDNIKNFCLFPYCVKLSKYSIPLTVPVGRQVDARESHVDAGEVPEGG